MDCIFTIWNNSFIQQWWEKWTEFCFKSLMKAIQYSITNHKRGKSVKMTQSDDYKQRDVIEKLYQAKGNVL